MDKMWIILVIIMIALGGQMFYWDYTNKHFLDNHKIIEETCDYDLDKCIRIATLYPKENRFFCIENIITQEDGCPFPKWTGDCETGNYLHCEWE